MKLLKHKYLLILTLFVLGTGVFVLPATAYATPTTTLTTIASANDPTAGANDQCKGLQNLTPDKCDIIRYIYLITNVLSAIVGVVIVAMITLGGIQYSMAGADPNKIQAAKKKISNALLALLLFVFGFAIVQWLIPGGVV